MVTLDIQEPNRKKKERKKRLLYLFLGGSSIFVIAFVIGYFSGRGSGEKVEAIGKSEAVNASEVPSLPTVQPPPPRRPTETTTASTSPSTAPTPPPTEWRQKAAQMAADNSHCTDSYKVDPPLLIVSMDGFRADYLEYDKNPALETLKESGVHAPYMRAVFPTKTFPNHYTIVTGLYPESHGIVDNYMFDETLNATFGVGKEESFNPAWWKGEPIWLTAKHQNKRSATFFWPGSDVEINGEYPTFYEKYNKSVSYEDRINQILDWLSLAEERPSVLTLYFEDVDSQGHKHGPDSSQVKDALVSMDQQIDRLMTGLLDKNLLGCVNIVFVSDHGMESVSCDRVIYPMDKLEQKHSDLVKNIYLFYGTVGRYRIKTANVTQELVSELINDLDCVSPQLLTLHKDDLPARLHYSNSPRIEQIVSLVEPGWQVQLRNKCSLTLHGQHGYDNMVPSMNAIFIGYGPAFKQNLTIEPFENIELYNLFCEITGLIAAPNNGTKGTLRNVLKKPSDFPFLNQPTYKPSKLPDATTRENRKKKASCSCEEDMKNDVILPFAMKTHLPFGAPYHKDVQVLLYRNDYVTSYDTISKQPRWTAFKINLFKNVSEAPCWMGDTRLTEEQMGTCADDFNSEKLKAENIVLEPLFHPSFSNASTLDSYLLSNAVLMYEKFQSDIFNTLRSHVGVWLNKFQKLYAIMGPVFDSKHVTSSTSVPVPSDFFAIFIRCLDPSSVDCEADSIAFLLPHRKERSLCQSAKQFIELHVSRIRDIELKTGLQFFVNNQTLGLQQRLKLGVDLWGL